MYIVTDHHYLFHTEGHILMRNKDITKQTDQNGAFSRAIKVWRCENKSNTADLNKKHMTQFEAELGSDFFTSRSSSEVNLYTSAHDLPDVSLHPLQ